MKKEIPKMYGQKESGQGNVGQFMPSNFSGIFLQNMRDTGGQYEYNIGEFEHHDPGQAYGAEEPPKTAFNQIMIENEDRSPSLSPNERRGETREEVKRTEIGIAKPVVSKPRKKKDIIEEY